MSDNSPSAAADITTVQNGIQKTAQQAPFAAINALLAALQKLQAQIDDLQTQINTL